jgi:hypothetical protein
MLRYSIVCNGIYSPPLEDITPNSSNHTAFEENMVNILNIVVEAIRNYHNNKENKIK